MEFNTKNNGLNFRDVTIRRLQMAWIPGGRGVGRCEFGGALIGDIVIGTNPSIAVEK